MECLRDTQDINFSVTRTGAKCLECQVREVNMISMANMGTTDKIINIHMEFLAPAIQRMTHTNL